MSSLEPVRQPTNGGSSNAEVSIIIVNWNSLAYLRECLQSIYDTCAERHYEIVVVDNASVHDETIPIRAEFPSVVTIRSARNLGFAGANNLGLQRASASTILFLNPDTLVIGDALAAMLAELKRAPGAAAIGCKLLNTDGSVQTSCIQRYPTILNQIFDLEFLRTHWPLWRIWGIGPLFSDTPDAVDVEVISGACLMITREAFERVGTFSERYFMYAEDVDLCYQTRRAGWRVCYTGKASIVHHGGGTSKPRKGNEWVAIMQRQAILKFCRMAHGGLYAAGYRCAMAFNAAARLVLLAVLFPFRRFAAEKRMVHSTSAKWLSVFKWAIGIDRSVSKLQSNT
jgi:N-acetylglucosaminyl-diphospho-decaprenol L-rhamnosyltransferase